MAGRPRTPIGSWGDIHVFTTPTGAKEARARFRDADGKLRRVSARAQSTTAAKRKLLDRLTARTAATAANTGGISPDTTIADLCTYWLDRKDRLRPQSKDDYRQTITGTITPAIGSITVAETTPGRIARFLETVSPGVRARARSILSQAFALAISHDAIPDNPVTKLPKGKLVPRNIVVLTPDDLVDLRHGVQKWQAGLVDDNGAPSKPDGRTAGRGHDLLSFVDILLATGCRPGEVAALRWCDIDFDAETPTVTVSATMVRTKGQGLFRQPFTKASDVRLLALPPYAVQVLAELRSKQLDPGDSTPVFCTAVGTHRDPDTIRNQWRRARQAAGRGDNEKFNWVDFRVMRRTVATLIDELSGDKDAAAQLGHASTAMTRKHYIAARAAQAPDLTDILERFAETRLRKNAS
ncbi:integrase family protein [Corynebacterium humireducens NBRC 106098 = DSM 45392]|uniref:Integrase family protein n=1 Tax=Corynebacterium humireducens NBRC 106098 = DSM 45392 TaxID=1223515 RepID=A0A0B5DA33_9CORY|nr:tyrosine-type recombinase/integrase [Corynebacterium humireducens]AJE32559.1 integrase family protein [Corynebacterium humireducens NBRC 106098 = DSM 45392]